MRRRRPGGFKLWRERRRFRKMTRLPVRDRIGRGRKQRRPGLRERWAAQRTLRNTGPRRRRPPRVSLLERYRSRRQRSREHIPKPGNRPKIPIRSRMAAAMSRPRVTKLGRPSLVDRVKDSVAQRREGDSPPRRRRVPLFTQRADKLLAGVVAGALLIVALTWLVSRTPAQETKASQPFFAPPSVQPSIEQPSPRPAKTKKPKPSPTPAVTTTAAGGGGTTAAPPPPPPPSPPPVTTTTTTTQPPTTPPNTTSKPPPSLLPSLGQTGATAGRQAGPGAAIPGALGVLALAALAASAAARRAGTE